MGRIKAPIPEKSSAKLAKRDGMHAMGGVPGLYLNVSGGSKSWVFRYMLAGRRRDLGLGSYLDFTLEEARARAREQRKLIAAGTDPVEARRALKDSQRADAARRMTFDQCVAGYIDAHGDGWRNPKHRAQWQSTLARYASPVVGELNVADVDTAHVLKILNPIWKSKTETASRIRGRIESVLAWAIAHKYRKGENPARWKGHLDQMLGRPSKLAKVEHHAALPYREIGAFMHDLRKFEGVGAAAVEFVILTAARSGEVRGATWSEINVDARFWKIPAHRMKAGKEHVVPLSTPAMEVIERMGECRLSEFVFPGTRAAQSISDMTMSAVLRRMGRSNLTVHGFRSTFRDWCAECTAFPAELAEMALAHAIGNKVEAAYRRGNLLQKRARMMEDWAKFCTAVEQTADVTTIRRA